MALGRRRQERQGELWIATQHIPQTTGHPFYQKLNELLADAEFDSERNHQFIRQVLGAKSAIPAKRGKLTWRIHGIRAQMRRRFPTKLYRQRALVETVFSVVKRKLSARAPGRSLHTQCRQALLLGLAYDIYRLRHVLQLATA